MVQMRCACGGGGGEARDLNERRGTAKRWQHYDFIGGGRGVDVSGGGVGGEKHRLVRLRVRREREDLRWQMQRRRGGRGREGGLRLPGTGDGLDGADRRERSHRFHRVEPIAKYVTWDSSWRLGTENNG